LRKELNHYINLHEEVQQNYTAVLNANHQYETMAQQFGNL